MLSNKALQVIAEIKALKVEIDALIHLSYDSGYYSGSKRYRYTEVHNESVRKRNQQRAFLNERLTDVVGRIQKLEL